MTTPDELDRRATTTQEIDNDRSKDRLSGKDGDAFRDSGGVTERGPIRRRIDSLSVRLEPFDNTRLTDQQAVHVRNVLESLLQTYFFEQQPWVVEVDVDVETTSSGSNDLGVSSSSSSSLRANANKPWADGSVTYVGLAQILENKPTADQKGVELTMNGLVYFAEGSRQVPDETELLAKTTQVLGDSRTAVAEALRDFFPATQHDLVLTVEAPPAEPDNTAAAITTTLPPVDHDNDIDAAPWADTVPTTTDSIATQIPQAPPQWADNLPRDDNNNQVAMATSDLQPSSSGASSSMIGVGVGVGVGALLVAFVGLFALQRFRKRRKQSGEINEDDDECLVETTTSHSEGLDDPEHGFRGGASEPRKAHGHQKPNNGTDHEKDHTAAATHSFPLVMPPTEDTSEDPESSESSSHNNNHNNNRSYLSSLFRRSPAVVEQHLEVSSLSTNEEPPFRSKASQHAAAALDEANPNHYEFTDDDDDDGLSDFDDVVSIQPHLVPLTQDLESFEKEHHSITLLAGNFVVRKDQLGSVFEEQRNTMLGNSGGNHRPLAPTGHHHPTAAGAATTPSITARLADPSLPTTNNHNNTNNNNNTNGTPSVTNTPTGASANSGSNLSYSSSSLSWQEPPSQPRPPAPQPTPQPPPAVPGEENDDGDRDDDDHRIRYSMMPNPYVRRRPRKDRSAPCVLADSTASGLGSSPRRREGSASHTAMVPKLALPSYTVRKRRSSEAVKKLHQHHNDDNDEDELAYSADEENTFGVPESDGWDPADTELSSAGDPPTDDEHEHLPSNQMEVARSLLRRIKSPSDPRGVDPPAYHETSSGDDDSEEELIFDSSMEI